MLSITLHACCILLDCNNTIQSSLTPSLKLTHGHILHAAKKSSCACVQIESGRLRLDTKLLSDCLMSLAVFEAWQEPLYAHLVAQAHTLPLMAYAPRSLHETFQVPLP